MRLLQRVLLFAAALVAVLTIGGAALGPLEVGIVVVLLLGAPLVWRRMRSTSTSRGTSRDVR